MAITVMNPPSVLGHRFEPARSELRWALKSAKRRIVATTDLPSEPATPVFC
jgi:hypothetical protein